MTLISALLIMVVDQKAASRLVMVYLGIAQIGAFFVYHSFNGDVIFCIEHEL